MGDDSRMATAANLDDHKLKLLPRRVFFARLARSGITGVAILAAALVMGMFGYHHFENLSWVDSFANAAMILSGMGPLAPLQTTAGKLFAGCYALFSGLAFITVAGIMLAPAVRRFLHKFHLEHVSREREDR